MPDVPPPWRPPDPRQPDDGRTVPGPPPARDPYPAVPPPAPAPAPQGYPQPVPPGAPVVPGHVAQPGYPGPGPTAHPAPGPGAYPVPDRAVQPVPPTAYPSHPAPGRPAPPSSTSPVPYVAYPPAAAPAPYPTYPVHPTSPGYPAPPSAAVPVAAPGPAAPPRWWQHPVRRWLLEAWIQVVCLFSMTAALAAASDASGAPDGTIPPGYMLAWLVAVPAGATVSLRRSRPVLSVLVTGLAAVLLPIDALAVLIALPWVIARRPPRVAWACGALAALAVTASQWRDAARRPDHALFSTLDKATGETLNMGVQGFVIVGAVLLAVSVAWGLLRRSREAAAAAARSEREQAQQVAVLRAELTTELTRQDERDLIARELHDTVAHHLSVVSLRASALEVSAGDDGVQDAARSMRASAHQALEEMRDLIAVLRDAQVPLTPGPMPGRTLADLPELVATARDGGADIAATVFVTDGAAAPATLTRAVYRIVQEALTNALKHAPYARVDLDVRAAPGDGVHLRVRNALATEAADAAGVPGSGTGIVGMRERAATVGGTVEAGRDGGTWQVVAHLPWPAQGGPTIEG